MILVDGPDLFACQAPVVAWNGSEDRKLLLAVVENVEAIVRGDPQDARAVFEEGVELVGCRC